jgi:hypothetical protein
MIGFGRERSPRNIWKVVKFFYSNRSFEGGDIEKKSRECCGFFIELLKENQHFQ